MHSAAYIAVRYQTDRLRPSVRPSICLSVTFVISYRNE